jgi:hypothetical protein
MRRQTRRFASIAALVAGLALGVCAAAAADDALAVSGASGPAAVVLARLSTDPRTPDGYSAEVVLHVKLRTFPFVGLTVHGSSSYRKPGFYHFQLQNLPRIAAKFDDLRYDLGDPLSWGERYDVTIAPASTGEVPMLRLTPKKPGLVTSLDIETDSKYGRLLKATWKRHDGGTIVLTQTYAALGGGDVVTQQHATIDIPHMRADVTATYSNVTLDTPLVAGVPER